MAETVVLKVGMSCQGCAGAVKRALGKMEGVESYDIDLKEQKVTVKGNVQPEAVLQTVSKTGKKTSFWDEPSPVPETKIESKPTAPETESKPAAPETESKPTAPETESKPAALETESKPAAPATEVKPVEGEEKATEAAVGAAS